MRAALAYEWMRLRTIRSTYWLIGLALTFQLLMTILLAWIFAASDSFAGGDEGFDNLATIGASTGIAPLFIAYILGLLGVFSMGHEYRHGMIRATLTAVPSRTHVFVAKVISTACVAALAATGCILIALFGLLIFGLDLPSGEGFVNMSAGTLIFTVLFALCGLSFAALTRNQTAALALLMLVPTLAEQIVRAIVLVIKARSDEPTGPGGVVEILKYLPFDAGGQMYTRASIDDLLEVFGAVPFGPVGGGIVFGVFTAILLIASYVLFLRRDA